MARYEGEIGLGEKHSTCKETRELAACRLDTRKLLLRAVLEEKNRQQEGPPEAQSSHANILARSSSNENGEKRICANPRKGKFCLQTP